MEYLQVCSQRCTCDEIRLKVDCTDAAFSTMPDIRVNTRALILDGNHFSVVEKTFFEKMSNLRFLSLAWNKIDDIHDGSFKSQRKVMKMYLNHNQLGEVPLALKHMRELVELDLSSNQIGVLTNIANSPNTTQEPWSNLTSIQRLMLDHNRITLLPVVVFSKLTQLEYLSVVDNFLVAIPDGSLLNLHHLLYLNVSNNKLTSSSSYRLTPYNQTGGRQESPVFLDDESDFSTAPTLEIDYLADNSANGITPLTFKGLWNLRALDLRGNFIYELLTGIFSDLTSLETLCLQSNSMRVIQEGTFDSLVEVLELYLHDNKLSYLPDDMFEPLRSLTTLDLDQNQITNLTPLISSTHMFKLKYISVRKNHLIIIPPPGFSKIPSLEELYLERNILQTVPEVHGLSHLRVLNLGYNQIQEILPVRAFEGTAIANIDLTYNRLETVLRETIADLDGTLQVLKLSGDQYVCDCRLQWILDDYNYEWMYNSIDYNSQIHTVKCKQPRIFFTRTLDKVKWSPENFKLKCTEYAEQHIVTILLLSWSGIVGFFLLIFWFHTLLNFKKKFGTRHPKKRYMALYYADKTSTAPLTEGPGQVTFRTFESESEGVDVVDEETTV